MVFSWFPFRITGQKSGFQLGHGKYAWQIKASFLNLSAFLPRKPNFIQCESDRIKELEYSDAMSRHHADAGQEFQVNDKKHHRE